MDTIVRMDVFIGILMTETLTEDNIAVIMDITIIQENDRAAFHTKDNEYKQYVNFALHNCSCAEHIFEGGRHYEMS